MLEFNNFRLVNVIELVSKSQKSQLPALLRLTSGIIIEIIITTVIITGIITDILKGFFKIIFEGILKGITKGFFKGIYEGIIEGIIKGFFKGIIKGIILVSLRVIDGGFCPGNEFLTLRRGLRHIRYIPPRPAS